MRKLDEVIREIMISMGMEADSKKYVRFYQLGIQALQIARSETAGALFYKKQVSIPVNEAGVAPFPQDFEDYLYVGICYQGTMIALTYSPDMCPPMTDDCGDLMAVNRDNRTWYYTSRDIYGRSVDSFWGANGYFKPYYQGRYFVIETNGIAIDEIKLVYKSSLFEQDGDYMVFPNDVEVIRAYILARIHEDNIQGPVSQKDYSQRRFIIEKRKARMKNNPIKPQQILDAIRR